MCKIIIFILFVLQLAACSKPSSNPSKVVNSPKKTELVTVSYNPIKIDMRENDNIIDISSLNFGDIFVGTRVIQKVIIKNNSLSDQTPDLSTVTSQKFTLSNNCSTLTPRSSCELSIVFDAVLAGAVSEEITILGNPVSVSANVVDRATQDTVYLSSNLLDFGNYVGSIIRKKITVINPTLAPVSISIINPSNSDFRISTNCDEMLAARSGCSLDIDYESTIDQSKLSELIESSLTVNQQVVDLKILEQNKTSDFTNINLSIETMDFGNFESGQNKSILVKIVNKDLKPKMFAVDQSNIGNFLVTKNTCIGELLSRKACYVEVKFSASQKGQFSNSLIIAGKPISLLANVPQGGILTNAIVVSSEVLDFGIMSSNTQKRMTLTVKNTSTKTLDIAVTLPQYFTMMSNSCVAGVESRKSCYIDYRFQTQNKPSLRISSTDEQRSRSCRYFYGSMFCFI